MIIINICLFILYSICVTIKSYLLLLISFLYPVIIISCILSVHPPQTPITTKILYFSKHSPLFHWAIFLTSSPSLSLPSPLETSLADDQYSPQCENYWSTNHMTPIYTITPNFYPKHSQKGFQGRGQQSTCVSIVYT